MNELNICGRRIGLDQPPLVIAEIGINHDGDVRKAVQMIDDAADAGCECVKFQCHIMEDEMIRHDGSPGGLTERIWDIVSRAAFQEDEERRLKSYAEAKGLIYLSTPFSRAAADRLQKMDVAAYKIGSGECNNYPLIRHVAAFGRPVILSTGMNDLESIAPAVAILQDDGVPFALMHCTSIYPTPYERVRLGAISDLSSRFTDAVVGLSDHSMGNHTCIGAVALGACILEKHFVSDKAWPGPDVAISIDPNELRQLVEGCRAVWLARGGDKSILDEEHTSISFAYASVVSIRDIAPGESFTEDNIWVKRPGTGEIRAADFHKVLGRMSRRAIAKDTQIRWTDMSERALTPLEPARAGSL